MVCVWPCAVGTAVKRLTVRGCQKVVGIGALSKLADLESLGRKRSGGRRVGQVPDAIRSTVQGKRLRQRPWGVRAAAGAACLARWSGWRRAPGRNAAPHCA